MCAQHWAGRQYLRNAKGSQKHGHLLRALWRKERGTCHENHDDNEPEYDGEDGRHGGRWRARGVRTCCRSGCSGRMPSLDPQVQLRRKLRYALAIGLYACERQWLRMRIHVFLGITRRMDSRSPSIQFSSTCFNLLQVLDLRSPLPSIASNVMTIPLILSCAYVYAANFTVSMFFFKA